MKRFASVLVWVVCLAGEAASAVAADCQTEFNTMMASHLKAGPYHVSSKGGASPYELDVVPPDRFRMKEYARDGSIGARDEVIITPSGGWLKSPGGNWEAIPDGASAQVIAGFNAGLAGGFKSPASLTCQVNQTPLSLPNGRKVIGNYTFKGGIFDMHSGRQVPTEIGLLQGEDGLPAALILRTPKGDDTQDVTYDSKIKIDVPVK